MSCYRKALGVRDRIAAVVRGGMKNIQYIIGNLDDIYLSFGIRVSRAPLPLTLPGDDGDKGKGLHFVIATEPGN